MSLIEPSVSSIEPIFHFLILLLLLDGLEHDSVLYLIALLIKDCYSYERSGTEERTCLLSRPNVNGRRHGREVWYSQHVSLSLSSIGAGW